MKYKMVLGILCSSMILWACDDDPLGEKDNSGSSSGLQESWSIPRDEIFDGGPGKDGIPALTDPEFVQSQQADYLSDDDLVIGFVVGEKARAYPHKILDWHEIINDRLGEVFISITYCPLTGTGIGWNREINGKLTTFGVSGQVRVYPFSRFVKEVRVINDHLAGGKLVIAGSEEDNFIVSFLNDPGDGTTLFFSAVQDQYPVVMSDNEGNMWDVLGRALTGPRKGAQLATIPSFMGYWFSFAAFYPDLSIYGDS